MAEWRYKLRIGDVFHNNSLSLEQKRDAIVSRIKAMRWYRDNADVQEAIDMFELQDDTEGFDYEWDNVYDLADRDRVWIETWQPAATNAGNPD